MEQASKALNYCVSQGEFEGSTERVEGERLLLESTHKYSAAVSEIKRLSTEGALGKSGGASTSRGSISFSGLALPLKKDFVKFLKEGGDGSVHYFVVLIKYRSRVVATQMVSTIDSGCVRKEKLCFPNLINLRDLDYDFQVNSELEFLIRIWFSNEKFLSDQFGGLRIANPKRMFASRGQISH